MRAGFATGTEALGLFDLNHYAKLLGRGNKEMYFILSSVSDWALKINMFLIIPQSIALAKMKPAASFKL